MSAKYIFAPSILIICLLHPGYAQCRKARKYEVPHGANEFILLEEIKLSQIFGKVLWPYEEPLKGAVVEVFKYHRGIEESFYGISEISRVAACVTDGDGRFSFARLSAGKYFLRAGTGKSAGMNAIHVVVVLNPKGRNNTKRGLELVLKAGT